MKEMKLRAIMILPKRFRTRVCDETQRASAKRDEIAIAMWDDYRKIDSNRL
jgi:hypothetical protein